VISLVTLNLKYIYDVAVMIERPVVSLYGLARSVLLQLLVCLSDVCLAVFGSAENRLDAIDCNINLQFTSPFQSSVSYILLRRAFATIVGA